MINAARGGSGEVGTEYHHGMLHAVAQPYPVKRCVSPATYEVDMFDKQKHQQIFQVNMLRKWHVPTSLNLWAGEEDWFG